MVYKVLNVLDQFVNPYPDDGGCDEGPGYWGAAAASLYDNISSQMQPSVEKVKLTAMEDKGIIEKWGDNIYRINFNVLAPKTSDKISFMIAAK